MESGKRLRLVESLSDLQRAIDAYAPSADKPYRSLSFFALAKAFEVALGYLWKYLKHEVQDKGLEAPSPKDAIRVGAQVGLVENPDLLIKAINIRNQSVHDYFSIAEEEFVEFTKDFCKQVNIDLETSESA